MSKRYRFLVVLLTVFIFLCKHLNAASEETPRNADVVMLPSFLVEDSYIKAIINPWEYISLPGFEILSRCPNDFTAAYVHALQKAKRARLAILPDEFWGELATPMKIILYNEKPKWAEGGNLPRSMDLAWSSGNKAIARSKPINQSQLSVVSDDDLFISCGNYRSIIQPYLTAKTFDYYASQVAATDGKGSDLTDFTVDPDSDLRLHKRLPRFASWFTVGMLGQFGLYANHVIESASTGEVLVLPNAIWKSPEETIVMQEAISQNRKRKKKHNLPPPALVPLGVFFKDSASPENIAIWNSEAALIVRWGLFAKEKDGKDHRAAFLQFVDQTTREPVSEPPFQKCFGLSFHEVEERLKEYMPTAITEAIRVPLGVVPEQKYLARQATSSEVARIVGTWARLEARILDPIFADFRQKCLDFADKQFQRECLKENQDPYFLAEYGLYAAQIGNTQKALETLTAATQAGVVRPRAYIELARLKLHASIDNGRFSLSDSEFSQINELLSIAQIQMPGLISIYNVMALVLKHAPKPPTLEELNKLRQAVDLFPSDSTFAYKVATIYRQYGYIEEAAAVVKHGLDFADTESARTLLTGVK